MHRYVPKNEGTNYKLEVPHLWMHLPDWNQTVREGESLFYTPGRTIAFPDLTDMLHSIGALGRWHSPRGSKGFDKADAMRLISAHYAADFESLLFLHHFDRVRSCRDHCCPKGRSRFNPELVALRGWKLNVCPGHANLSRYTHQNVRPCPCAGSSRHKFCWWKPIRILLACYWTNG